VLQSVVEWCVSLKARPVSPTHLAVGGMPHLYNGDTMDRQRNNHELVALAAAARTASVNSADLVNYNHRGLIITIRIVAATSTPVVTMFIDGKMGGVYEQLWTANDIYAATGIHSYILYTGNVEAKYDLIKEQNTPIPRIFRVRMVHGDTDSLNYSVSCNMLL
ncbi:hypothetical protein LCGC14_2126200, partial [marine sediment metagenome]